MTMRRQSGFFGSERGATSGEFALVLVVFLALVFGTLGLAFAVWANETLQFATEATARCRVVTPSSCSGSNLQSYAMSQYAGPGISATFASAASTCGTGGQAVTGTGAIPLDAILVNMSIPLSAAACFP